MSCSSAVSHSLSWVAASVESRHRPFLVLHAPSCCPRSHPYRPPSAPPSLTPSTKGLLSIHIIFVFLKKNVLYRWNGTIWNLLWLTFSPHSAYSPEIDPGVFVYQFVPSFAGMNALLFVQPFICWRMFGWRPTSAIVGVKQLQVMITYMILWL